MNPHLGSEGFALVPYPLFRPAAPEMLTQGFGEALKKIELWSAQIRDLRPE
jgi:hypothetical protein